MSHDPGVSFKTWLSGAPVRVNGWPSRGPNKVKGGVAFHARGNDWTAQKRSERGQGYVCEKPVGGFKVVPGKYKVPVDGKSIVPSTGD